VGEIYGELAAGEYRICMSVSVSGDKEKYDGETPEPCGDQNRRDMSGS
jgi:hypothetical protein